MSRETCETLCKPLVTALLSLPESVFKISQLCRTKEAETELISTTAAAAAAMLLEYDVSLPHCRLWEGHSEQHPWGGGRLPSGVTTES